MYWLKSKLTMWQSNNLTGYLQAKQQNYVISRTYASCKPTNIRFWWFNQKISIPISREKEKKMRFYIYIPYVLASRRNSEQNMDNQMYSILNGFLNQELISFVKFFKQISGLYACWNTILVKLLKVGCNHP